MKRVLSLLFAIVFVIAAFPVTASAADVIEISDAAQLAAIGNNENYPLSGSYKLTKNISLSSYDNWTPIGQSSAFSGTFEGNGKTISGLKVNSSGTYAGLFGQVSGTVKNLTVTGSVTLNNTSSSATSVYAGLLAGNVSGWFASIDSCSTSGEVKATLNCTASWGFGSANVYAGGVIGNSSSWIAMEVLSHKSGAVTATYSGSKVSGDAYAGGVAGKTTAGIVDSYNKADVTSSSGKGSSYAGGLAGYCASTETSYNTGAITAGTYCGSIAGYATGSSKNCYYETGSASQAFGGYSGSTAPTATAKKASEMTNKKLSGFNFDDVWEASVLSAPNHYSKNEIITGSVSVLGNFQVGEKLTADMNKVTPSSAYDGVIKYVKYQWEAGTKDSEGNITFTKISGATGSTYTIASGDMGKYIRVVVRGRFTYGGKLESKEALVTAAVPKNVKVENTDNGIKVTWDKISGASQYTIYRSTYSSSWFGSSFGSYTSVGTATTNSYTDSSVTNNTKYKYKVSVTMNGTESDQSAESAEISAQLPCQHQWDSGKETTKASCEKTGVKTYTCSLCKGTRTETIPATGHNYKTVTETNPTCEKEGSKTVYCSNCYTTKTETTKATGHSYDEGVITTQPNCETEGVKTYTCATCKGTKTEKINPTGHSFNAGTVKVEPTCTKEGVKTATCSRCNVTKDVAIEKTAHKFDGGTVTKQPTCEAAGSKTYKCSACGLEDTEEVKALGHDFAKEFTIDKPATTTETGTKSKHCSRCDERTSVTVIPKLNLELTAPVISTAKVTTSGVKLAWGAVEGAAEYKVYRKVYNASTKKWDSKWKRIKTLTGLEYVDGTVELGTKYKYLVKAVNGEKTKNSESTSTITFKITPTPKAYIKSNGIKIKWSQVVSADEYRIYRAEYNSSTKKWSSYKKVKTASASSKEWTDKKVTSGKKYKYCIKAVNGKYVTDKKVSNSLYFLTKTKVTLAKAKTGIKVSWTAVKGASKYRVYRSELQNGVWSKFTEIATPTSKAKSYTDTKVVSGVQYKYKVKAVKDKTGQTSSETSAMLYLQAPTVKAVKASDGINVTWSETTGATEYVVYRKTYDAKKKKWSGAKKQTTVKGTEWKDTAAKSGTKYKYCVRAKNGSSTSAYLSSETVKR